MDDQVPAARPSHLAPAEALLEQPDPEPRVFGSGGGRRDAPQVVDTDATFAGQPHHRPLEGVTGVVLRLAALLATAAAEQVEGPVALDHDHARGEQLALPARLQDDGASGAGQ